MANQELLDYIMRQRSHGANSGNIREALLKAGWDAKDVEEGIAATEPKTVSSPVSPAAPSVLAQTTSPLSAAQPFVPAMASPAATPVAATVNPATTPVQSVPVQAPVSAPVQAMSNGAMSAVTMSPTPAAGVPVMTPGASVLPTAVTPAPAMSAVAAPVAAMPTMSAAAPVHPIASGVQIPSANFMPKVEAPHVAPITPTVTTVMPSMQAAAPVEHKSHLGLIIGIIITLLVLILGGGFAYWKYVLQVPAPVIPADQPAVQDVLVTPEVLPPENIPQAEEGAVPEGGIVAFPSSIPVATTTEATTTTQASTSTKTTTTSTSSVPSPKKSATSTSVLPPGAI